MTGNGEVLEEAGGWTEPLLTTLDATVRGFKEIVLEKWGVSIVLILEALDSKCEDESAFRAILYGVRDDIDHRLWNGRWE